MKPLPNPVRRLIAPLAVTLLIPVAAFGAQKTESVDAAPGERLEVNLNGAGSIEVTGWSDSKVEVTASTKGSGSLGLERTSWGAKLDQQGWPAQISGTVQIRVPHRYDLEIHTMGGRVSIHDVDGEITGETMGGPLDFSKLGGKVHFTTMGGDIKLIDSEVDGKVETMGGTVLLKDVIGNVKGSSMGGAVEYQNVTQRDGSSTGEKVVINTMGGSIEVDEALYGAELETMGGEIRINRAGEWVAAETMGGNVTVRELDGGGELSTMGGNIEVHMVGNAGVGRRDLDLESLGGQIIVTLPADLDMTVDVELVYTKKYQGKYSVQSDFPLNISESPEWEHSKHWGNPRKTIRGTASFGSGQHRVSLSTINGDVIIRRGN